MRDAGTVHDNGLRAAIGQAVESYASDGVAVVPRMFSIGEMSELRSASLEALTQAHLLNRKGYRHAPVEYVRNGLANSPALLFWPRLVNATLDKYATDPRIVAVVGSLLGPDVKQLNNQFYYRLAGDGDNFAWHQDIMFRHPLSDYPRIVERNAYLQVAIIVDDFTPENAPIMYVKGSHLLGNLQLHPPGDYSNLRRFDAVDYPAPCAGLEREPVFAQSGDVLIWSALTVHASRPNTSTRNRFYYMNGFTKAECSRPWPYYLRDNRPVAVDPSAIP